MQETTIAPIATPPAASGNTEVRLTETKNNKEKKIIKKEIKKNKIVYVRDA